MSTWSNEGNATLGELIKHLRSLPGDMRVAKGFSSPHSYRGYYEDLAFEPADDITVREMLAAAESALGQTFTGYKGGEFMMSERTDCWLSNYGETGVPIVASAERSVYILPTLELGKAADAVDPHDGDAHV